MNALLKVARGVDAAHGILKKVRPGLVVGTGGYVQIPVVCAAILQGIPVVLLEPNKVTGLANRIFQPWVARLVRADGKGDPVGIPVSPEMLGPPPTRERFLGDHLRIMVLGGSQGARFLNEKIPGILKEALSKTDRRVEILHQSGERWKDSTTTRYRDLGLDARVEGFVPGLSSRFAEQTLIVARAGAMTVAEITASGTPAIYVPFPFSAGGHQKMNAEGVQAKGAGWCWTEGDLDNAGIRAKELSDILFAPDRLFDMAVRAWNSSTAVSAESWLQALGGRNE
jgi:UDP-N-acetylglucosamine--N-acetylmuramyl-(pentapeptide) pyrophosphoryl-undecaprenol N-acetylglucosamine transferase